MPSVVYGPGNHEGQAAPLPPRPTSPWEFLAGHVQGLPPAELRRVAMLTLRVVCNWRLDDIGALFDLHKGHVCREVERARLELAGVMREKGIELTSYDRLNPARGDERMRLTYARLRPAEWQALTQSARESCISESRQAREWMLDGGLRQAVERDKLEEDPDAVQTSEV